MRVTDTPSVAECGTVEFAGRVELLEDVAAGGSATVGEGVACVRRHEIGDRREFGGCRGGDSIVVVNRDFKPGLELTNRCIGSGIILPK
jgi:hypothetical protein